MAVAVKMNKKKPYMQYKDIDGEPNKVIGHK